MTMLFMDGFDYLTSGNLILKWDSTTGAGLSTTSTGVYGRGKMVSNGANGSTLTKTLPSNIVTGFQGFHFFYGTTVAQTICEFRETGAAQCDIRVDATGHLFATRNGTTIGSVSTFQMTSPQWYWIEVKVVISTTVGVAEIKVNGAFVANNGVSNLNTQNTANAFFNQIRGGFSQGSGLDSYHVWDTTAGDITTYMGERVIDTQLANATGTNAAWTKNGGSNNFDRVNEANEDGDTTYNSSATPNQIDSFNFPSLFESTGTIGTVAVNTIDRNDDATPRTFDHYCLSSGVAALSAPITPGANYVNHQTFFGTDPNTAAAWTITNWNAAEWGYKEIS